MKRFFHQLDAVLRGDATRISALEAGEIDIRIRQLGIALAAAAAFAGLCMGSYAVVRDGPSGLMQMLASAIKLPMLFLLTLLVTLPSLYVFNALVGSYLKWESVLRLLLAANAVMLAVFASLGPIIVFFGLSTTSYPFMKILNVLAAGAGGVLGLAFLLRTLQRLVLVQEIQALEERTELREVEQSASIEPALEEAAEILNDSPEPSEADNPTAIATEPDEAPETESTLSPTAASPRIDQFISRTRRAQANADGALNQHDRTMPDKAKTVFRVWVVVYAIVGAQMGWVLRPFIGAPDLEFAFFRDRESNFFLDFFETLGRLFGM